MNEQTPFQEIPPPNASGRDAPVKRRRMLWFVALPLLACAACAALSVYALIPLRGKILDRFSGRMIPVTGEETVPPASAPTSVPLPDQKAKPEDLATPVPSITPQPGADRRPDSSGMSYRNALDDRLNTCTISFHEFLILEQAAFDQPDLLASSGWRSQARDAATAFHDDCQALGSLPNAPTTYAEVDQLLKKAAGEVQPATDDFSALLDASEAGKQSMDKARSAMRHMLNFIRYTQHAEDVLSGLDEMKQI